MNRAMGENLLLTPRRAALIAAVTALAVIGGAWFFEHVLGILPCELCLMQRIPYYVAIPVALVSSCLPNRSMTIRIGLMMLALIFLFNAGLAAYHSGVEWKWWPGPAGCSGGNVVTGSAADLLQSMQQTKVVSCSDAGWRFLGLSLAGWNVLICSALMVLVLAPLRR